MKLNKSYLVIVLLLFSLLFQIVYFKNKLESIEPILPNAISEINSQKEQIINNYYSNRKVFINSMNYVNNEDYQVMIFGKIVNVKLKGSLPQDVYLVENSINNSVGLYFINDEMSLSLLAYTIEMYKDKFILVKTEDYAISLNESTEYIIDFSEKKRKELEEANIKLELSFN